jgi:choline dehydrogenase-like flavoprotein
LTVGRRRVTSLEARVGRRQERLRVRARLFVLAAGAIGSSALLLASGLRQNVGTRLSFNAGAMVVGEFPEALDAFDADQMSVYVTKGDITIECTHNPLMSAALTTPGWFADHGRLMSRTRHLAYAGGLVGTEATGQVRLSRLYGHEEVHFRLSQRDMQQMRLAIRSIAEVFFAAGASRVVLPTHRYHELRSVADLSLIDHVVRTQQDLSAGSAHPQGGNPFGADPRRSAVDPALFVHGVENLALCDASVFPSSMHVNPIDTILAMGKILAPNILARA